MWWIVLLFAVAVLMQITTREGEPRPGRASREAPAPRGRRPAPVAPVGQDQSGSLQVRAWVRLDYRDDEGNRTTRTVRAERYDWYGDGYIYGFCELRQDYRTFKLARIRQLVDLETGEVLTSRYRTFFRDHRIRA